MTYLARLALIIGAAAFFAGCGGSQPPVAGPGAMPQSKTSAIITHAGRGGSWMASDAKREKLIYSSDAAANGHVFVFSYVGGKLVGTLNGFDSPTGVCSDNRGNVWITNYSPPGVIEYAHGGTAPIATLSEDASAEPFGCSVDATTGDLAISNYDPGTIAVFHGAAGNPTYYSSPAFATFWYCAYDTRGDLFATSPDSYDLAEIRAGSGAIQAISLNESITMESLQWDGLYLTVAEPGGVNHSPNAPTRIYRISTSGSTGTIVGQTKLTNLHDRAEHLAVQYWIDGKQIIGPDRFTFDFWSYPAGGKPARVIRSLPGQLWGTTVSRAPK